MLSDETLRHRCLQALAEIQDLVPKAGIVLVISRENEGKPLMRVASSDLKGDEGEPIPVNPDHQPHPDCPRCDPGEWC